MRSFRHLPLLLRALRLLGMLAVLAGFGVLASTFPALQGHHEPLVDRGVSLAVALLMVGGACNWPVIAFQARFHRPGRAMPWLDSWQGQLAAALVLAALPMCVVGVLLLVPPSLPLFGMAFLFIMLSALLLVAANIWGLVRYYS